MIIVGITGAIGHGKSSLAEALVKQSPKAKHFETYRIIADVADAWHVKLKTVPKAGDYQALNAWIKELPPILKRLTHVNTTASKLQIKPNDLPQNPLAYQKLFQHLDALKANPKLSKTKVTDANKSDYRAILQWLGGYLAAKASPTIWWDEMIRQAKSAGKDGAELAVLGGVRYPADAEVVRSAGGKIIQITRPGMGEKDAQDPTERERAKIKPDVDVINNGTLKDLQKVALDLLKDLEAKNLRKKYISTK